jgi:hypothetical protein
MEPHFPFIGFWLEDLARDSPRRPDLVGHNGYAICLLNNEEIDLGGVGKTDLKAVRTPIPEHDYAPVKPEKLPDSQDLTWILPLAEAAASPALRLRDGLADAEYHIPTEGKNLLAARTLLGTGRLYTAAFRRTEINGQSRVAHCWFETPSTGASAAGGVTPPEPEEPETPNCRQPLATEVVWDPALPKTEPLVIRSTRFRAEGAAAKAEALPALKFRTPTTTTRGVIDVNLWNATFADLLDLLRGPSDKSEWHFPRNNSSFRSFYRLLDLPKGLKLPRFGRSNWRAASFEVAAGYGGKNPACPCSCAKKKGKP